MHCRHLAISRHLGYLTSHERFNAAQSVWTEVVFVSSWSNRVSPRSSQFITSNRRTSLHRFLCHPRRLQQQTGRYRSKFLLTASTSPGVPISGDTISPRSNRRETKCQADWFSAHSQTCLFISRWLSSIESTSTPRIFTEVFSSSAY